jgi:hypothetical protein
LNSEWRQSGKKPQQLEDAPELPEHAAHLWSQFLQLHNSRGNNGMEANRITADKVKDWMWFNGLSSLELWEKKAIHALDNCWFESRGK